LQEKRKIYRLAHASGDREGNQSYSGRSIKRTTLPHKLPGGSLHYPWGKSPIFPMEEKTPLRVVTIQWFPSPSPSSEGKGLLHRRKSAKGEGANWGGSRKVTVLFMEEKGDTPRATKSSKGPVSHPSPGKHRSRRKGERGGLLLLNVLGSQTQLTKGKLGRNAPKEKETTQGPGSQKRAPSQGKGVPVRKRLTYPNNRNRRKEICRLKKKVVELYLEQALGGDLRNRPGKKRPKKPKIIPAIGEKGSCIFLAKRCQHAGKKRLSKPWERDVIYIEEPIYTILCHDKVKTTTT